ncbi:MAG: phospholipase, partial [Alphaproteobacteria bacterium]|nr:phospholipase [Alphaproteobacteria bacterium]
MAVRKKKAAKAKVARKNKTKSKTKSKAKSKAKAATKKTTKKKSKAKPKSRAATHQPAKSSASKTKSVPKPKAAVATTPAAASTPQVRQQQARQLTPPATAPRPAAPAMPAAVAAQPGASAGFEVVGTNAAALFTLKLHRGEGMTLLAMNWKNGQPPQNFVGFAIEYQEPGGNQFFPLNNRLGFLDAQGNVDATALSTLQSPIQKFRWVHFPHNAELPGDFQYRVTPMFMDAQNNLSKGEPQQVAIQLARETYPGIANVTFTRGFVSSQAFVDRYLKDGPINTLVAPSAAKGLDFKSTHPDSVEALAWMGFEARAAIIETLDQALADTQAQVRVVAYDFNLPEVVDRLEKLGGRLKIIIDDSKGHGGHGTAETEAEGRLVASAGRTNVLRQHMGSLQHNKTIAVNGPTVKKVVCGSTNLSWRGFFVQANNALVLSGQTAVDLFFTAFDNYFNGA